MFQVFIWLAALAAVVLSGALLALQWLLRRPSYAIFVSCITLAAVSCLIGADSLRTTFGPMDAGWAFVTNACVLALAAGAIASQVSVCWWLSSNQHRLWKHVGVAALLVCQVGAGGWIGWRYQLALQSREAPVMDGGVNMDEIPGEALLTDKHRLVPVFRARVVGDLQTHAEFFEGDFDGQRIERANVDARANCHGWVFTGGQFLLKGNGVEMILADNGYEVVEQPRPGDVIVYRGLLHEIVHTGLVRTVFDDGQVLIESKWGVGGRFLHMAEAQYYSRSFAYYRNARSPGRPGGQSPHLVQAVKVLPGNHYIALRPEEALVNQSQPDSRQVDSVGYRMPVSESYPIGAE